MFSRLAHVSLSPSDRTDDAPIPRSPPEPEIKHTTIRGRLVAGGAAAALLFMSVTGPGAVADDSLPAEEPAAAADVVVVVASEVPEPEPVPEVSVPEPEPAPEPEPEAAPEPEPEAALEPELSAEPARSEAHTGGEVRAATYAVDAVYGGSGAGEFFSVDTAAGTQAHMYDYSGQFGISASAWDPTTNTTYIGTILDGDFSPSLRKIDVDTGEVTDLSADGTIVTPIVENRIAALAFDPIGAILYGGAVSGQLFTIDRASGLQTNIGDRGLNPITAIAFDFLQGKLSGGSPFGQLFWFNLDAEDPEYGAQTNIGEPDGTNNDIAALTFDPSTGRLLGESPILDLPCESCLPYMDGSVGSAAANMLFWIDPATGAQTDIGAGANGYGSLEIIYSESGGEPPAPEPPPAPTPAPPGGGSGTSPAPGTGSGGDSSGVATTVLTSTSTETTSAESLPFTGAGVVVWLGILALLTLLVGVTTVTLSRGAARNPAGDAA